MASNDNGLARSLHDLGLVARFGGSLMGATGVNGAGAMLIVNARMGEQQRPGQVGKGLVRRLFPGC